MIVSFSSFVGDQIGSEWQAI